MRLGRGLNEAGGTHDCDAACEPEDDGRADGNIYCKRRRYRSSPVSVEQEWNGDLGSQQRFLHHAVCHACR